MSAPKNELLQASELALAGKWDAAHQIVQQYEDDATAAWIHAVLHKMEGDLINGGLLFSSMQKDVGKSSCLLRARQRAARNRARSAMHVVRDTARSVRPFNQG